MVTTTDRTDNVRKDKVSIVMQEGLINEVKLNGVDIDYHIIELDSYGHKINCDECGVYLETIMLDGKAVTQCPECKKVVYVIDKNNNQENVSRLYERVKNMNELTVAEKHQLTLDIQKAKRELKIKDGE